jgi:ATP-dependent Clp protease ATP-binding subunit ClpA
MFHLQYAKQKPKPDRAIAEQLIGQSADALRQHLAKKGFAPLMGARPMQRLIQDTIRRALADELLFGRLVDGGRLTVDVDADGKPALDIQPARRSDKPKAEPATA